MQFIIKISPEITIKSKAVRKKAIVMLKNNILKHFKYNNINIKLSWNWDRLILKWDDLLIPNILKKIPGIANFMEVLEFLIPEETNKIFDYIFETTKFYYLDKIENKTFVVRVNRVWNHDFRSIDLERYIWGGLLKYSSNSKVKLTNPDITIKIDIKDNKFYIVNSVEDWVWGFPTWFQDKILSLISWWFDSCVSTFSMIKRWCKVDYLFFNLWWISHEMWVKQISYYLWKNYSVSFENSKFICVNFEELIKELLTKVNHKYRWILLKRYMLKVASMISENNYYAIVKWDSLWQVSSQTLLNMHVIDKASENLVLRPLIWSNKQEIIDLSRKIWTYEFSCNMPEYCGVISDKPSTWASLDKILKEEENILDDILIKAVENRKIELVKNLVKKDNNFEESKIETVVLAEKDEVIIDIREDLEKEINPLNLENILKIDIPFFELNEKFSLLDSKKTYLLYCERGVLSNSHWLQLKEKGFNNIKILRLAKKSNNCNINI